MAYMILLPILHHKGMMTYIRPTGWLEHKLEVTREQPLGVSVEFTMSHHTVWVEISTIGHHVWFESKKSNIFVYTFLFLFL